MPVAYLEKLNPQQTTGLDEEFPKARLRGRARNRDECWGCGCGEVDEVQSNGSVS
jgi:hypothetical protein